MNDLDAALGAVEDAARAEGGREAATSEAAPPRPDVDCGEPPPDFECCGSVQIERPVCTAGDWHCPPGSEPSSACTTPICSSRYGECHVCGSDPEATVRPDCSSGSSVCPPGSSLEPCSLDSADGGRDAGPRDAVFDAGPDAERSGDAYDNG